MKQKIWALTAAVLVFGGSAALLRAHESGSDGERGGFAEKMADRMKEKLGLSDEQEGKVKALFKARRDAAKPLREQMKASLKKLQGQVDGKASDKEIEASLDQLKAARKAMMAEREKFIDSLSSVLSPTQRGKAALAMAKMMRHRREGWREGGCRDRHSRRHEREEDEEGRDD